MADEGVPVTINMVSVAQVVPRQNKINEKSMAIMEEVRKAIRGKN